MKKIITMLLLICSTAIFAERTLSIKNYIVTRGVNVKLKDIVSNSSLLTDKEKELVLFDAPKKSDRQISMINLAHKMQNYSSLLDVLLSGGDYITLKKIEDLRYINKVKDHLTEYLSKKSPWKEWKTDLLFTRNDELLVNRMGDFDHLEIAPTKNQKMLGSVIFSIKFYDEFDRPVGKTNIAPVISREIKTFVVEKNITQGQEIKKSDLKEVKIWIGSEKNNYVSDAKDCIGMELNRHLASGDIVKYQYLRQPLCASRSDKIWVTSRSGALLVRVAVIAKENGRLNDSITVQNTASKKTFKIRLTGKKQGVIN